MVDELIAASFSGFESSREHRCGETPEDQVRIRRSSPMDSLIGPVLREYLTPRGFEAHPFLVQWYNDLVQPELRLPYSEHTLAYVIVSGPSSFENAFIPYCERQQKLPQRDIYDSFMIHTFNEIRSSFPGELKPDMIHDFDIDLPSRRPRVVLQTASHVSGAAFHYDFRRELRDHIDDVDALLVNRKLLGVCIHPKFGGWFGLRGVAVFPQIEDKTLERRKADDVLSDDLKKLWLCEEFNLRYFNNLYRDVNEPVERSVTDAEKFMFPVYRSDFRTVTQNIHQFQVLESSTRVLEDLTGSSSLLHGKLLAYPLARSTQIFTLALESLKGRLVFAAQSASHINRPKLPLLLISNSVHKSAAPNCEFNEYQTTFPNDLNIVRNSRTLCSIHCDRSAN